jgi:hypothetical protein
VTAHENDKAKPERSQKARVDNPPREISPTHDEPEHPRGQDGQFTDKGAPGIGKR